MRSATSVEGEVLTFWAFPFSAFPPTNCVSRAFLPGTAKPSLIMSIACTIEWKFLCAAGGMAVACLRVCCIIAVDPCEWTLFDLAATDGEWVVAALRKCVSCVATSWLSEAGAMDSSACRSRCAAASSFLIAWICLLLTRRATSACMYVCVCMCVLCMCVLCMYVYVMYVYVMYVCVCYVCMCMLCMHAFMYVCMYV
jgi:hypothetical protein